MIDSPMLKLTERLLNVTATRHATIAGNIANIDTPGYRTRDVDFRREMLRAETGLTADSPSTYEVPGLVERPDGNNVDMDREALLLAENQYQYRAGVELLRNEFRKILTAINEGR